MIDSKWTSSLPVDVKVQLGVQSTIEIPATPVIARIIHLMAEIRRTGKCGMFVVRWDGQAWCFHVCDPPCRVNEA
jgi:hypothetical protein